MKEKNYSILKRIALENGALLFGVADMENVEKEDFLISRDVIKDLPFGISIGVRLSKKILEEIVDHPTRLYYHHYRQVNIFLDQLALRISNFIQGEGYNAIPIPASQTIDWKNQRGHLSHKRIGKEAGLGWIGRNNLLVNPEYGAQFRLVTILTDFPLKTDKPMDRDCGDCRKCIEVCPVGAIKEDPKDFDHIKCYELLKGFQKKGYVGQYICGICVKVCSGLSKGVEKGRA